jgi:hypothetical protein
VCSFLEKHYKYLKFFYCYCLFLLVCILFSSKPNKLELYVNASSQGYIISILANKEQVLISNNHQATTYLLGEYSLANGTECKDSINEFSTYQNEFCSVSKNVIQLFNEKLVVLSNAKLNSKSRHPVDLIFLKNYRSDLKEVMTVFSPKTLLLDAVMSKRNRQKLKLQCQELGIPVVDLSSEVYVKNYQL